MHLSAKSKDKAEAARWVRLGLELTVIDPNTDRPIQQGSGQVEIVERGWTAVVTLRDGLVTKID